MQIHNNILIAECSAYDFKEMVERRKVKSWLKSVSAFANTDGGSLFYGVNDDGVIVGLENPQDDADFISETIKARLDPVPEIQLIPIEHESHTLLEVKVKAGMLTPYYYYQFATATFVGAERHTHDMGFAPYPSGCQQALFHYPC